MKTPQLTITFPEDKTNIKKELMKRKKEEQINVSAFVVSCLEKEFGITY
jgi:post-segregation antitoxin (ccd killing protein)